MARAPASPRPRPVPFTRAPRARGGGRGRALVRPEADAPDPGGLTPNGITASPVVGTPVLSVNLVPAGITASPVVGAPLLEVSAAGVTALTLDTATGGTGQITYAGTYLPADLSPAPTITITAIRGGSDIATEAADTVSAGSFSGVITVSAGSSTTLRAEALGNSQDISDPVTVT